MTSNQDDAIDFFLAQGVHYVEDYERITGMTGLYPEGGTGSLVAVTYCALGLGEAGELQGKVKKIWRGDEGANLDPEYKEKLLNEAGDVLWYLTRFAIELGSGLQDLMDRNGTKVLRRLKENKIKGSGDDR